MRFTYGKKDKLKHKAHIDHLFTKGKSISFYPLRLLYAPISFEDGSYIKTGVSVSKRLHNKAVVRNRIKRLIREAYRLNKPIYLNHVETSYALMILYLGKEKISFDEVNISTSKLFNKFIAKTQSLKNNKVYKNETSI